MMGTAGNEAVINREAVLYNGVIRKIPAISGNAIRHDMIREPGALHLIKTCGLKGKLNIDQANYLLYGGSLTESSTTENLARIAEMQELLPLIRLLGGSLRNQIVGGSFDVQRGVLVCEENRKNIRKKLPEGFELPEQRLRFSEDFIDQYQYTRGDARRRNDAALLMQEEIENGRQLENLMRGGSVQDEEPDDPSVQKEAGQRRGEKTNLMIYSGQSVIAGAVFYHGFVLKNTSLLEIGALFNALQEWDALGGTIGGSARIGHGRLQTSFWLESGDEYHGPELDIAELIKAYREHCKTNKEKIVDWLMSAFPKKERKEKPKKANAKLADEAVSGAGQGELL
jgi:CRISPR type IV-associated protein Csf2